MKPKPMDLAAAIDHLYKVAVAVRNPRSNNYSCMEDFVLKEGFVFNPRPLPRGFKAGREKFCFDNAWRLARTKGLLYVEGFAAGLIPVLHAWCSDEEGNVIDPTWAATDFFGACLGSAYLGVPIQPDYVEEWRGDGSVLDNWHEHWPMFTRKGWRTDFSGRYISDEVVLGKVVLPKL